HRHRRDLTPAFFLSLTHRPPTSPLFPYTTLFRSVYSRNSRTYFRSHTTTPRTTFTSSPNPLTTRIFILSFSSHGVSAPPHCLKCRVEKLRLATRDLTSVMPAFWGLWCCLLL